jgi:hypothetical protein
MRVSRGEAVFLTALALILLQWQGVPVLILPIVALTHILVALTPIVFIVVVIGISTGR